MTDIRIETMINSETLHLPQLKPLIGKSVEIVVREMPQEAKPPRNGPGVSPLAGTVLEYIAPLEPAVTPQDWETNR